MRFYQSRRIEPQTLWMSAPSSTWQGFLEDYLRVFLMWGPVGHDYRSGEDKVPWLEV